jgi:hypothetical protein
VETVETVEQWRQSRAVTADSRATVQPEQQTTRTVERWSSGGNVQQSNMVNFWGEYAKQAGNRQQSIEQQEQWSGGDEWSNKATGLWGMEQTEQWAGRAAEQ